MKNFKWTGWIKPVEGPEGQEYDIFVGNFSKETRTEEEMDKIDEDD